MTLPRTDNTKAAGSTCVFTIVSRNYFHFALNLMASVAQHLPGAHRVVVICDERDGLEVEGGGDGAGVGAGSIELLGISELSMAHLDRMVTQYTILELNTAIKPFAFAKLFEREAIDKLIYFDPDIQLFSTGAPLLTRLDAADVVLTPHLTAPLNDSLHPSDLSILHCGTYNLGFLALRRSPSAQDLLAWWQRKLLRDCVVDIPRGLFTDQKWMDLVPGLYAKVHVERDPGWNVAYWNLLHRQVSVSVTVASNENAYFVNHQPLFFFHFSGWNPSSDLISKHQNRFRLAQCGTAVIALFAQYDRGLSRFGRQRYAALPYAFATLADGTPLPDCARQVIREQLDWDQPMPELRSAQGARFLIDYLTAPTDELAPPLSRLGLALYRARADLRDAFADLNGLHREAFVAWFAQQAPIEAGVSGALLTMRGHVAHHTVSGPGAADAASRPAAAPAQPTLGLSLRAWVWPYRTAYRLAWHAREVLRPLTTLKFRTRARAALMRRAYATNAASIREPVGAALGAQTLPFGVTVVGYVKAESGVGESARSTLRALHCTQVPHALADYQAGNVSRMGELVDERLASGQRHAVSLFHINADQLPLARTFLGEALFAVPYRIGFWAWELENFPAEWHNAFDHVDEVWVPSSFCQKAIAAASPVPVLTMPHAIELPAASQPDRARFGLRSGSVVFLAMADMMSSAERKNPIGAVEAFALAFRGGDMNTELVVKLSNAAHDPQTLARLQALTASCHGIHLIADYLDRPALNCLIDSVDCLVSLHRAEGFGLVLAESMARGKLTIATAWSGNMDFMTARNSLLVDFQLQPLAADAGPYRRGERWAEPCVQDAAKKMRLAASDATLRQAIGERARADCRLQLSPEVVGRSIAQRLQAIRTSHGL